MRPGVSQSELELFQNSYQLRHYHIMIGENINPWEHISVILGNFIYLYIYLYSILYNNGFYHIWGESGESDNP